MSKMATCFDITAPKGYQFMKTYEKYNLRFSQTDRATRCNSDVSENCSAFIFRVKQSNHIYH